MVADDEGVKKAHRDLCLLVKTVAQGKTDDIAGKHDLDLLPKVLICDKLLSVKA